MEGTGATDAGQAAGDVIRTSRVEGQALAQALVEYAFQGYCALFALCVLLLAAWVFWPRGRCLTLRGWRGGREADGEEVEHGARQRRSVGFAGALLLLLLSAISQQTGIDRQRGFIADVQRRMEKEIRLASQAGPQAREELLKSHYLYLPQGHSLRYLTLGNSALGADYLWLSSLQYVSSPFRQGHKFDMLRRFYDTILELDPGWIDIHVNAGKILSALDPNRTRTEQFYNMAITRNPDDFRLPIEAGRLYVVPPVDPRQLPVYSRKASEFFECALSRKALPPESRNMLMDMKARLLREAGFYAASAENLWQLATEKENPEGLRERSAQEWLQADSLVRVETLQRAANEFKKGTGRLPRSLSEAVRGVLQNAPGDFPRWFEEGREGGAPMDAYGMPIEYDPATGAVSSRGVKCLRARQVTKILESLTAAFTGYANGRFPKDMHELTAFVRNYYAPPNDPPFPVLESLGLDLDCTRNPMGGEWRYDSATGKFELPPECDPKELFHNRRQPLEGRMPRYFAPAPSRLSM